MFTSNDGQSGVDGNLSLAIFCYTFIDVLVTWRPQGLDSENGAGTLIKLYGLWSRKKIKQVKKKLFLLHLWQVAHFYRLEQMEDSFQHTVCVEIHLF